MKATSFVTTIGAALACLALGYALRGSPTLESPTGPTPLEAAGQAHSKPARADGILVSPTSQRAPSRIDLIEVPLAATKTPAETPHVSVCEAFRLLEKAIAEEPVFDDHDGVGFAEKYAGATANQLQIALVVVRRQQEEARKSIVAERLRAGLFDERIEGDGSGSPSVTTTPGSGPVSYGFETLDVGGVGMTRFTTIPSAEYPEYRSLELEWYWLHQQVRSHGLSDCEPR